MITSRDIQVFFNMLDVIANPERAKQVLSEIAQRAESLDSTAVNLAQREVIARNKTREAEDIIASKQSIDTMHEEKAQDLVQRETMIEKATQITSTMKKELDQRHSILSELGDKLREKEAKLKEWEEKLMAREGSYLQKAEQLAKNIKEHAEKVLHLKSLV